MIFACSKSTVGLQNVWKLFKVNIKDTRTTAWRRTCVFTANFERISNVVLVFLSLSLNK